MAAGETQASLGGARDEAFCATCSRSFQLDASHCPHDGSKLVVFKAQADTLLGKILDGRYEISAAIGEGGMGAVYKGRQLSTEREIAIKVVHAKIAAEREASKRFLREARLTCRLNAPGIVQIYDSGQSEDGVLFIVMELLRGPTLGNVLKQCRTMPPARVVPIIIQLCDALEAAHQLGIVHRDLKPGNIILESGDLVKVLDFGLAKSIAGDATSGITATHALLGTPLYMAPEQIESPNVDARTDLYSVGCIMHELLAGTPPFVDTQITALLAKHLTEPPPPLPDHVPQPLAMIVGRLLAKQPSARFGSATELRTALLQVAQLVGTPPTGMPIIHATPPAGFARVSSPAVTGPSLPMAVAASQHTAPPRRRIGIILAVALLATGIGVAVVMATRSSSPSRPIAEPEAIVAPSIDAASAPAIAPPPVPDAAPATIVHDAAASTPPADAARKQTRKQQPRPDDEPNLPLLK